MNVEPRTIADAMAVQLARLLTHATNVFHGLASPLPAVAIGVARRVHNRSLEYLNIAGGVNTAPAVLAISTCAPEFLEHGESFFSLIDVFDLCARGGLDTAFLGGVQIDRHGRINNSVIGPFHEPKVKLPGDRAASEAYDRVAHPSRHAIDPGDLLLRDGRRKRVRSRDSVRAPAYGSR